MAHSTSHTDDAAAIQLPSFHEFLEGAGILDDRSLLRAPDASSSAVAAQFPPISQPTFGGQNVPTVTRRHTFSDSLPAPLSHHGLQARPRRATTQSPSSAFITLDASSMDILNSSSTLEAPAHSAPATPQSLTCAFCGRTFTRRSTFLTHENTHSHSTAYLCRVPGCGLWYTVAGNAYRHLRTRHGVPLGQERSLVAVVSGHAVHPPGGKA